MGPGIESRDALYEAVEMSEVTRILNAIEQGDVCAADQLLPAVYEELRLLAAQKLSHEPPGQTLQATGGTGSYVWSLAGGTLPAGLSLSSDGVISGTPVQAGTFAFTVEALTDAGVEQGLTSAQASRLAVNTMAGSAALLASRRDDAPSVRRQVTSPGGVTAAGLAALERSGVRAAFADAVDAVVTRASAVQLPQAGDDAR